MRVWVSFRLGGLPENVVSMFLRPVYRWVHSFPVLRPVEAEMIFQVLATSLRVFTYFPYLVYPKI